MAKRKDKVARLRLGIVGAVAALAVLVTAFGLLYEGDAGDPYRVLEAPDGDGDVGDVRVVAYFSFACPHCRRLEELMEGWAETLPAGVAFRRAHVAYSSTNRLLAKAHLALLRHDAAEANRSRLFAAIQDRSRQFSTLAALADYVADRGIERQTFLRTAESPRIARLVAADEAAFAAAGLTGVPALVVDGKYVINMALGRKQALAATRQLAAELAAERASTRASTHVEAEAEHEP